MNNHNIDYSRALKRLILETTYRYRGYSVPLLPNGNVRLMLNEMTKEQFHAEVDGWHEMLQRSLERAFTHIQSPCK